MRRLYSISIIVLFSAFIFSCGNKADADSTQTETHQKAGQTTQTQTTINSHKMAPDFALKDSKGNTVRLSDHKGKIILVNFWATWCGPCRMEIPGFVKLYEKYKDKGFTIIGISVDQAGWQVIKPFMKEHKINYPIVLYNNKVITDYGGIRSIPTTFFINSDGEVLERIIGLRPDSYFEGKIKELLAKES